MALSENAQLIMNYLQANDNVQLTAKMIAEALDLSVSVVNGTLTGLQSTRKHPAYTRRVEVEGSKDKIVELTPEGEAWTPEEDAE